MVSSMKRAPSPLPMEQEPAGKKTKEVGSAEEAVPTVDKKNWQGFCEIESDPAYFSVILREIGVQGVTVREVPFLDPDTLSTLPNPILGLVLLFRHRQVDVVNQAKNCPDNVWFANQMPGQNSCATLAMIHALLNLTNNDSIDIGEHMRQFKDFTKDFSPYQRGEAFASWEFVKRIHNSFAKKMDILENDKYLAYKANKATKDIKTKQARRGSKDSIDTDDSAEAFEENAHHFIAFVPINGEVWKLDGMDAQPTCMGTYDEDKGECWTDAISDRIMAMMAAGGDDDYGVYAISQSPLASLRKDICQATNTFEHVETRLNAISTDWKEFLTEDQLVVPPSPSFFSSITQEEMAKYPVPEAVRAAIDEEDMSDLVARRVGLLRELMNLVSDYTAEEQRESQENDDAEARRWDYGPAIKRWLEMLAENGWLEENLHNYPLDDGKGSKAKK